MERPTNEDKANEVARNSIWREHVKKEDSLYRAPSPFRVDPKRIRECFILNNQHHSTPLLLNERGRGAACMEWESERVAAIAKLRCGDAGGFVWPSARTLQ